MGDVQAVLAQLAAELGPGAVLTDPDVLRTYSTDAARFCPAGTAAGMVRVRSTAEVSTVPRLASQHRVPVVPQGARTGLAGGGQFQVQRA